MNKLNACKMSFFVTTKESRGKRYLNNNNNNNNEKNTVKMNGQ